MASRALALVGVPALHLATFQRAKAAKSGGRMGGTPGFRAKNEQRAAEKKQAGAGTQREQAMHTNTNSYIVVPQPMAPSPLASFVQSPLSWLPLLMLVLVALLSTLPKNKK